MAKLNLSPRLTMIADFVPEGDALADVGCDHGWLGLSLLAAGKIPAVIGCDLREGPIEGAREHARLTGLSDRASFRLSDGLDGLEAGEAKTLVISGMGGALMAEILLREKDKTKSFKTLILEPQKEQPLVRKAVRELGFVITDERMAVERGKYYPVIKASAREERETEKKNGAKAEDRTLAADGIRREDAYGPVLIRRRDPVLKQYLLLREAADTKMLEGTKSSTNPDARERRSMFSQDLEDVRFLLSLYESRGESPASAPEGSGHGDI
jgi:tRNA (adenine22-N1)-methyltransferase